MGKHIAQLHKRHEILRRERERESERDGTFDELRGGISRGATATVEELTLACVSLYDKRKSVRVREEVKLQSTTTSTEERSPFMIFERPKSVILTFAVIKSAWSSRMFSGFKSLSCQTCQHKSHTSPPFPSYYLTISLIPLFSPPAANLCTMPILWMFERARQICRTTRAAMASLNICSGASVEKRKYYIIHTHTHTHTHLHLHNSVEQLSPRDQLHDEEHVFVALEDLKELHAILVPGEER